MALIAYMRNRSIGDSFIGVVDETVDPSASSTVRTYASVLASEPQMVKDGSTFISWNTSRDGSGTSYQGGETVSGTVHLYAIWTANGKTYTAGEDQLLGIADAIRGKTGGSEGLSFPDGFINAIGELKNNVSVENVLSAIRSKFPENLFDSETSKAQVEAGVTYTISADVTFDGQSHYYSMQILISGGPPNYVTSSYMDPINGNVPGEGEVRSSSITFTPSHDGILTLSTDSGNTFNRVMMVVGNSPQEYMDNAVIFPADYLAMIDKLSGQEITGVYF